MNSKWIKVILFLSVMTGVALAGSIKTWTTEVLTPSDLNTNFSHIHNSMVGGHGARLVNADVSASAAISHTKLATPALLPKAWAVLLASCGSSPCTVAASSGVTSITRSGTGLYVVTIPARTNANYWAQVSSSTTGAPFCTGAVTGTTSVSVACYDGAATPALADGQFGIAIFDDDN